MIKKIDRFNNIIFELAGVKNFNIVNEIPKNFSNAVLLKNCNDAIVRAHNATVSDTNKLAILQHVSPIGNTYLIKNSSNCPLLVDSKIVAGGVSVIYLHDSRFYGLFVHDKTKKYLTVPGGTATPSDFEEESLDSIKKVALRELNEETKGTIMENSYTTGIIEKSLIDLKKICEFNFNTKFFDIDVDDTYTMYGAVCNNHNDNFKQHLFNKKNLVFLPEKNNVYNLKYVNHPETNSVYAIELLKINNMSKFNHQKLMEHITKSNLYQEFKHPVTYLHIYATYINLARFITNRKQTKKIITSNNFPPNLIKFTCLI